MLQILGKKLLYQYQQWDKLDSIDLKKNYLKPFIDWYTGLFLYTKCYQSNSPLIMTVINLLDQLQKKILFSEHFKNDMNQLWDWLQDWRWQIPFNENEPINDLCNSENKELQLRTGLIISIDQKELLNWRRMYNILRIAY